MCVYARATSETIQVCTTANFNSFNVYIWTDLAVTMSSTLHDVWLCVCVCVCVFECELLHVYVCVCVCACVWGHAHKL